ncbi:unnamed protein product, partial [Ectocarpus sp. 12 AP-2014]
TATSTAPAALLSLIGGRTSTSTSSWTGTRNSGSWTTPSLVLAPSTRARTPGGR